jgi:DNA-binding response OmpR family regulator
MTRVLVVEDESKLAAVLAERLGAAQYTVDLAQDGEEALAFTSTTTYDAIVLDLQLPRIDGLEVCRRLRAASILTPVLVLTARDTVRDKIVGLDSGADDYVTKPFALGELLARLRALLRRESTQKDGQLRFLDLTLEPPTQIVRWGERTVDLTTREFRILATLLRYPGWVVSRDLIIESVWGFGFSDSSNLVEVYIRRLRRKLADAGAPALIGTVRGAGYRLQEGGG